MYIPSLIFLTFVVSCYADDDIISTARNFSINLVESIGFDHGVIGTFNIWNLMASAALWTEGESQNELAKTIFLSRNKNSFIQDNSKFRNTVIQSTRLEQNTSVRTGYFIFIDKDLNISPEFRKTLNTDFGASISTFDFNNIDVANLASRIVRSTFDTAPLLFPGDFTSSTMIMVNIVSFEGFWTSPFNKSLTTLESNLFNNQNIMHNIIKIPFTNMEEIKANVMELSIGRSDKYCMLMLKPHKGVNLMKMYKYLRNVTLIDITNKLQEDVNKFGLKKIDFKLPRITIRTQVILDKALNDMGISDIFQSDRGHFPGISTDDIYVSSVEHHAYVTFDEIHVNAFAVSSGRNFLRKPGKIVKVADPFIFFILEKSTTTVLFSGLYSRSTN